MIKRTSKKILSFALVATLVFAATPVTVGAAQNDHTGHWAASAVKVCEDYGILEGVAGNYNPDVIITRAEFCTMVNRAFHYTNTDSSKTFTDVDYNSTSGKDVKIASAMGYIEGYGEKFGPNDGLTQEQAFTILAKIYNLQGSTDAETRFTDDPQISAWARTYIDAMNSAGYVNGTGNGALSPQKQLTKGEVAQVLWNLFGTIADKDLTEDATYQNLTIRQDGVSVKSATVTGDLFITDGVGTGDAAFENITVKGRTLIAGGGSNSVSFNNSSLSNLVLAGTRNTHVNLIKTTPKTIAFAQSGKVSFENAAAAFDAASGKLTLTGTFDKIIENSNHTVTISLGSITTTISSTSPLKSVTKPSVPEIPLSKGGSSRGSSGSNTPSAIAVTGVTVSPNDAVLSEGSSLQLTAIIVPSNATNQGVTWSSDNTAVATVNASGLVMAVASGTATIMVSTADGTHTNVCNVTVNALINAQVPTITVQPENQAVFVGDAISSLNVTASVTDGGDITYQWYRNTTNSNTDGDLLSGETNSSYAPLATEYGTTYYYCQVTNTNTSVNGNTTATVATATAEVYVKSFNITSFSGRTDMTWFGDGSISSPQTAYLTGITSIDHIMIPEDPGASVTYYGTDSSFGMPQSMTNTSISSITAYYFTLTCGDGTMAFFRIYLAPDIPSIEFDGENANKIMQTADAFCYSLDSGSTWKNIDGDQHQLAVEEIDTISSGDDAPGQGIKVKLRQDIEGTQIINLVIRYSSRNYYSFSWAGSICYVDPIQVGYQLSDLEYRIKQSGVYGAWKVCDATDFTYTPDNPNPIYHVNKSGKEAMQVRIKGKGNIAPGRIKTQNF
ncbi:hypothetical protein Ami103574_05430 [Aminipila butyrica]|uniref:S-layer homology domain n=1 Tax=Aminipila butyrica TaxID=433296 RepID=A0A858BVK7_9FIRM|nr:S-layer homology domain-containing protein [Aminipila butyrica]QIB68794.1 hypothetical protein Ami103574_05430 [Aminipila butyrica]